MLRIIPPPKNMIRLATVFTMKALMADIMLIPDILILIAAMIIRVECYISVQYCVRRAIIVLAIQVLRNRCAPMVHITPAGGVISVRRVPIVRPSLLRRPSVQREHIAAAPAVRRNHRVRRARTSQVILYTKQGAAIPDVRPTIAHGNAAVVILGAVPPVKHRASFAEPGLIVPADTDMPVRHIVQIPQPPQQRHPRPAAVYALPGRI